MIEALIGGETDPNALAGLAHRRIKVSSAELEAALRGRVTDHHRFMLRLLLQHIDAIDAAISQIDQEVDAQLEPFRTAVQLLTTIPGINELSACVIPGLRRGRLWPKSAATWAASRPPDT
jgi:transposase